MTEPQQPEDITPDSVIRHLTRGAEPYWMQDIRAAMRNIEAARLAARQASLDASDRSGADPT